MKKKLLCATLISVITLSMGCVDDGPSTYEKNLDSGMEKFTSGNYDSMTAAEKDAVDDFLEWQDETY